MFGPLPPLLRCFTWLILSNTCCSCLLPYCSLLWGIQSYWLWLHHICSEWLWHKSFVSLMYWLFFFLKSAPWQPFQCGWNLFFLLHSCFFPINFPNAHCSWPTLGIVFVSVAEILITSKFSLKIVLFKRGTQLPPSSLTYKVPYLPWGFIYFNCWRWSVLILLLLCFPPHWYEP